MHLALASIACLICFVLLGLAAFDFLSPNLTFIAKKYRISQAVMGVTVLAFGNGCVDVMSAIASAKAGEMGMALGAIIGGCLFVVCVVTGAMGMVQPFEVEYVHLIRDAIACLVATSMVLIVSWDQKIKLVEALSLLFVYIIYSGMVIYIESRHRQSELNETYGMPIPEIHIDTTPLRPSIIKSVDLSWRLSHDDSLTPLMLSPVLSEDGNSFVNELLEPQKLPEDSDRHIRDTLATIFFPFDSVWVSKVKYLIMPFMFCVCASVPKPEYEESKIALTVYALATPVTSMLLLPVKIDWWSISSVALITTGLLTWIWVCRRKIYESMLVLTGFFVAMLWVLFFANTLVKIVVDMGASTGVPKQILGFTVFALGDSMGDLVSNITIARLGFSKMAFSACFGGPVFTLLVGVSTSAIAAMAIQGTTEINFQASRGVSITAFSIILSIVIMLTALLFSRTFGRVLSAINLTIWLATTVSLIVFAEK